MSEFASTLLGGWSRNGTLVTVRFMLGRPANDSASGHRQRALVEEQADHGDLVQLDFVDSYRNLTLKGVATMQWLTDYCASTRYEPNLRRRLSRASLHCALSLAAQCIVIGPVCLQRAGVVLWICYHNNSKLRASIFTKLGL